jgi:bacillithiol biosynthesis cysteine-adding enzyme BshC
MATAVRAAIDLRRFPWIRPLVAEYASDFARVSSLFAGNPANPADWASTIARVQRAPRDRAAVEQLIAAQLERRAAPPEARAAGRRLADPRAVAIVTGQQAGLFGGPLYTLLKAVTAVQLARRVESEHGVPAVPVFWVDAEDHDWEEVRAATVLDANLAPRQVQLDDLAGADSQPVSSLVLDNGISDTLAELEGVLAATEFTGETFALLRQRYAPGARFTTAFAGFIDHLLGRLGLVVFEADDRAAKPLVADLFEHELTNTCRTINLVLEAGERMAKLGHTPQVQPDEESVALFYLDGEGRRAIRRADGTFVIGEAKWAADALRQEARTHPERFSPNVVLRPLVQDRLFPTICYVAGPSELAYQAQLGGIYRELRIEAPLLYPRATATIVDSSAAKFLDRSRLPLEALHAQDESALNRLLESLLPPTLERTIEETEASVDDHARRLKSAVLPIDPTLAGAVDTTAGRMRETLKSLHSKIIHATKRKDDTLRRQFNRTRALTFPNGDPQERVLSIVFFANRYGPYLADRLVEVLPIETDKHYVLTL